MITSEPWIIYALVFGTVLLAVQAIYFFLFKTRRERTMINRRLALGAKLGNSTEVLEALRRERGSDLLAQNPIFRGLNDLLIQSGVRFSAFGFVTVITLVVILFFVLLRLALG